MDFFLKGEQESDIIVVSSWQNFYCWLAISLSNIPKSPKSISSHLSSTKNKVNLWWVLMCDLGLGTIVSRTKVHAWEMSWYKRWQWQRAFSELSWKLQDFTVTIRYLGWGKGIEVGEGIRIFEASEWSHSWFVLLPVKGRTSESGNVSAEKAGLGAKASFKGVLPIREMSPWNNGWFMVAVLWTSISVCFAI